MIGRGSLNTARKTQDAMEVNRSLRQAVRLPQGIAAIGGKVPGRRVEEFAVISISRG